jgi:cytoskeletal protein CcmA (bactofilin family)
MVMRADQKRNLLISGMGSSNGGSFQAVKIDGIGRIVGDVDCKDFNVTGRSEVQGNIDADKVEMKGSLSIQGNVKASMSRFDGGGKIEGNYVGETLVINGAMTISGSCETEKFSANGRLQVGTLSADDVSVTLHGHSKIGEIGGERIQVRRQRGIDLSRWLKILPMTIGNYMTVHTIEGDHIYLEYTSAEVVRGANIVIGPGCQIERIEYTNKLEQDKRSKVKYSEKM